LGISDNGLKVLAVGTIVGVRWQRVARLPTRAAPGQRFALDWPGMLKRKNTLDGASFGVSIALPRRPASTCPPLNPMAYA